MPRCARPGCAASGRATSRRRAAPLGRDRRRPGHRGLLQLPSRHGGEGGARMLGRRGARDALSGAGHRGGGVARRGVPSRGPVRPAGLAAPAAAGGGGMRRGRTDHGRRQPVALAPHRDRAGNRWARRGLAGLHDPARAPRRRARRRTRGARRQRPGGARVGGRDQGDPRRAAAGQPGLERGGVGRHGGGADAARPVARRRACDRCRSYPARRGRGADRRAGGARLRRPQRPGPRGAARRPGRLRRRRGRLGSGALSQPDGVAPSSDSD